MRKLYTFLTLAVFCIATGAKAQISSITDLYGTYTFTSTCDVKQADLADKFSSECEVTIGADPTGIYKALIANFAGAQSEQSVNKFDAEALTMKLLNPSGGNGEIWGGKIYMADPEGHNPYGATGYNVIYTYDEATKTINVPDFTLVTVSDWSAEFGNIVASFTNVKMTLKNKQEIEVADISGNYHFTCGTGTWSSKADSDIPTEMDMVIVPANGGNNTYGVSFDVCNYPISFKLDGTFDGTTLTLPFDSLAVNEEKTIFLSDVNGRSKKGSIEFSLVGKNLSLHGMSFITPKEGEEEGDSILQWYLDGVAKSDSQEEGFSYDGTYNITATPSEMICDPSTPTSGTMTIEYDANWDMYLITEFMGYDTYSMNWGGIEFKPNADDPTKGEIVLADNYNILEWCGDEGHNEYLVLMDANNAVGSIPVTIDENGVMTTKDFCITKTYFDGSQENQLLTWYTGMAAEKAKIEWTGTHAATEIEYAYIADGAEVPSTGNIKIAYDETWGMYLIEDFLGYDTYSMNWGGIELKIDESDPTKATITTGEYCLLDFDPESKTSTDLTATSGSIVELTLNADGSITIGKFAIVKGGDFIVATNDEEYAPQSVNGTESDDTEAEYFTIGGTPVQTVESGATLIQKIGDKARVVRTK